MQVHILGQHASRMDITSSVQVVRCAGWKAAKISRGCNGTSISRVLPGHRQSALGQALRSSTVADFLFILSPSNGEDSIDSYHQLGVHLQQRSSENQKEPLCHP
ncbi:predicted protein [Histoplasma capsulatum H143]|uniref:Uncharacterized protein n=1 Tax=Ajellomyces capsulatus (strain H143) TaxID=544712 RepID=C6HMT3_AJECH|nr:predicted protein [Histoplasma capsulatum H143]